MGIQKIILKRNELFRRDIHLFNSLKTLKWKESIALDYEFVNVEVKSLLFHESAENILIQVKKSMYLNANAFKLKQSRSLQVMIFLPMYFLS